MAACALSTHFYKHNPCYARGYVVDASAAEASMRPMRPMAATAILLALATPAASITFPWAAKTTAAKACITSAQRGDLVEALGQLEAARDHYWSLRSSHIVLPNVCGRFRP